MQRFPKSLVTAVFFLLAFLGRTSAQDSPGSHPGVFLAPGYLSKAANLAAAEMLGSIKAYTHAAFPNQPLAAAPNCMMAHDALSVDTVSFSSLLVTPLNTSVNSTVVRVAVQGVTPLQTTTGSFQVQCQYWGAFTGSLQLPQNGTVAFTVTFEPSLTFDIEVVITPQGTLKTMSPALRSNVRAQPTYAYQSQGFALNAFVAHHFGTTLVNAIESEITALVSYPSPFASSFANQVSAALSIYQFMCGTPSVLDTTTLALWMQPGCAPPSASANVSTSLLLDHDLLLLIPSSSGEQAMQTSADPLHVAVQQMMPQWRKRVESAPLPSSCTAGIPCPPTMNVTTALSVAFSECVVCYPDNGVYTEFSAVVTMLP